MEKMFQMKTLRKELLLQRLELFFLNILSIKERFSQKKKKIKNKATFHDKAFIAYACLVHSDLFTVLKKKRDSKVKPLPNEKKNCKEYSI